MLLFLFDDNKIKMARKPGKKLKENPVGCIGEGKDEKEIYEKGIYESFKTETVLELR